MRTLALLLVLLTAAPARAGTVGIVVTGDENLQPLLSKQFDGWLRSHGHTVGEPFPADAVNALLNCMLIDDQGCAQGVVAAQSKTDVVLYGQAVKSRTSKATVITVYWLYKDKEPIGMRRACEECSDDLMRSIVDEMLGLVANVSSEERGRIAIHSKPEGMTVLLDNENIGVTPIEREMPVGNHHIVLVHRGQRVGERALKVQPDVTAEITIPVTMPKDTPETGGEEASKVVPGLVLGLGGAAIATGAVLYFTSEVDDGSKPMYRDTKPLGLGVAAGGVVLASLGAYLWLRSGPTDSTPVATIDRHGGIIGWARAF